MQGKSITFTVPGAPTAKGRARSFVRNGHVAHYTPGKTVLYENLVKMAAQVAMGFSILDPRKPLDPPIDGACELNLTLHMPIPASWSAKKRTAALAGLILPTTKPDSSNVLKAIEDAMNGVVWIDDKQVVDHNIRRRYSDTPKAIIEVRRIG
jgi:Holliday junction resolvase RusA-like endonuclease